jgi:solute carrier family 25 phosphate transporter 23/24/25/41
MSHSETANSQAPARRSLKLDTLVAGGTAGACARTATGPLDRVKILMQTQHLTSGGAPDKYRGLWQGLVRVAREDGVKSYWRGNFANCIRVFPYSATQFITFDHCKVIVCGLTGRNQPTVVERLACGATAGICASVATHPLDVVRTRMAVQPELRGVNHTFSTLWKEGGVAAFYKGLGPTIASLAPFVAINFASYDTLKALAKKHNVCQGPGSGLLLGAGAGIIAQTACYPLDTIRRRMQLKGRNYTSTADAMRTIVRTEGAKALYKGMSANTLKVVPNNAIRFMVFENLKASPFFQSLFVEFKVDANDLPRAVTAQGKRAVRESA